MIDQDQGTLSMKEYSKFQQNSPHWLASAMKTSGSIRDKWEYLNSLHHKGGALK